MANVLKPLNIQNDINAHTDDEPSGSFPHSPRIYVIRTRQCRHTPTLYKITWTKNWPTPPYLFSSAKRHIHTHWSRTESETHIYRLFRSIHGGIHPRTSSCCWTVVTWLWACRKTEKEDEDHVIKKIVD